MKKVLFPAVFALFFLFGLGQENPWLIQEWSNTTPLPQLYIMGAVSYKDYILAFRHTGTVYKGKVEADGSILQWDETLPVPEELDYQFYSAVVVGNRVIVPAFPVSYIGSLAEDGEITAWVTGPAVSNPATAGRVSAVYGNRVYTLGGAWDWSVSDVVETALLNDDGSLSSWNVLSPLPTPVHDPKTTVIGDRLYVFGGEGPGGSTSISRDVYRADILEDGSLGPWESSGLLLYPRPHSNFLRYGGTVHLVGGGVHSYLTPTVESVIEDQLGNTPAHVLSQALPTPLNEHSTAVVRNYGYVMGGNTGSYGGGYQTEVYFTILGEPPCSYGPAGQPLVFVRERGKPVTESVEWESCGGPGQLVIENSGVSAAVLLLNGSPVATPDFFNPNQLHITIPVTLLSGMNHLDVELRSKPGSSLAVRFDRE